MRSRRGLTLVELTLAGILLAMAVVPFLGALKTLASQTGQTRLRIVARTLARAALERYRLESFAALARLGSPDADPALALPAGPLAELVAGAGMKRAASLVASGPGKAILRVSVTWTEGGHAQVYELSTLVVDESEVR